MNRYKIYAPHKCGSSILRRMTAGITNAQILPDKDFLISTDTGDAKINFSRNFDKKIHKEDSLIFIPRNPIAMCISAYYSFGYTHAQPRGMSEDKFVNYRERILKQGLQTFVEKNINQQCELIKSILHYNHWNKTIIPYELMVNNFNDFLKEYLNAINMNSKYESAYARWSKEFNPIEDRSDLIESKGIKPHKRTTDIYEWKQKLDQVKLQNILEQYSIINEYCQLLSAYNL